MYPSWAQLRHNSTRRLPDHLVRRCEWGHTSRSWLFLLMACLSASPSCDRRRIKSTFTAQVPGHTRLFSGSQRQLGSTRSEHRPTHYLTLGGPVTSILNSRRPVVTACARASFWKSGGVSLAVNPP